MLYVGQNALQLTVETGINLAGVSSSQMSLRYFAPDLSTGSYNVNITASTAGTISHTMSTTESFMAGYYVMWSYINYTDGRISIGEPFSFQVKPEGTL